MKKAIIDNSVLRALYYLDLLDYTNLVYQEVFLPRAVEKEFLSINDQGEKNNRFKFLSNCFDRNRSWFKRCNFYRDDLIEIALSDINQKNKILDRGEGEAIIQNQLLANEGIVTEILLDEKKARKFAKTRHIERHGVLYLLAIFDLRLKLCDYYKCTNVLMTKYQVRFSKKIIEQVYLEVKKSFS